MATDKDALLQQLLPYRGQGWLIKQELGAAGMAALAQLCDFSPTTATEFLNLGTSGRKTIGDCWTKLGIKVIKRNWAQTVTPDPVDSQWEGGLSLDDWELLYLAETNRRELAPVFDWSLPRDISEAVLVCVSDLHYGPPEMDLARWLRLRDWIAENKHVRWVGLGDFLDTAIHDSPGMGGEGQCLPYDIATQLLERHLEPIAKQCLMMLSGNHEERVAKKLKLNLSPIRSLAEKLGIAYRGNNSYLRLAVKQGKHCQQYDGYIHHGIGSARTMGGKLNTLQRTLEWNEIDFLAMGHTHAKIAMEFIRKRLGAEIVCADGQDCVRIEQHMIPLAFCGSFLKHEARSYSRAKGLSPASLGAVDFRFAVDRHAVHTRV